VAEKRTKKTAGRVLLVPLGHPPRALLDPVSRAAREIFGLAGRLGERIDLPPWTYLPERRQYDSTEILRFLGRRAAGEEKILGVTDADICVSLFTYVFGEAELPGRAAIVSMRRFRQAFYGLPDDAALTEARTVKEALHELGHTLGLVHCIDASCLMHAADTVEDTDVKRRTLCPRCLARLGETVSGRDG